ncbi:MAG: SDR family NAD(P)-dependent oxidoreductase [Bacteroidales bacterium]|jgi:NADP-dependent 3-hydroxy acid dehydrogenase YdfG|nr:SDR family NAD(P)-dependent oxidoreductase [Bacteroidales bacterium]
MNRKTALITGATSGIGMDTARLLADNGWRLVIAGRRSERLKNLAVELADKCPVLSLPFDVRQAEEVNRALQQLSGDWQNIDALINNAGLAAGLAPVDSADMSDWDAMIDTNIKGALYMLRHIAGRMKQRRQGHIINIASIAGREAYPNGAVYCATKHAIYAISKAMRIELLPFNVKVTTISPGAVETEFSLVRFKGDKQKADNVYRGFTPLSGRDVAETILFVLTRPAHVTIDDLLVMPVAQASARDFYRTDEI